MLKTAVNYSRQEHGGFLYPEVALAILQQSQEMEKHMILATIRMTIPPPKHGEALKILRWMAELCRDDPGCLSCHIYGDQQENNVLMLEEVWRTRGRSGRSYALRRIPQPTPGLGDGTQTARDQVRHHLEFDGYRDHRKGKKPREMNILLICKAIRNGRDWENNTTIKRNKEGLS